MGEVEDLLGESWLSIRKADKRLRLMKPFRSRHRLSVIADVFEAFLKGETHSSRISPFVALGELIATRDLFWVWRDDPLWVSLVRSLKNPAEYAHTLVLLALADSLRRNGEYVTLNPIASSGRSPDLVAGTAGTSLINLEVKIAQELLWPTKPLTPVEAGTIVKRLFRSAGTQRSGQLAPPRTGILVIGGLSSDRRTQDLLQNAAERHLLRPPADYSHILGVLFTWVGTVVSQRDIELVGDELTIESRLLVTVKCEFARNLHYTGPDGIRLKD
jgi:hypothetical protein